MLWFLYWKWCLRRCPHICALCQYKGGVCTAREDVKKDKYTY